MILVDAIRDDEPAGTFVRLDGDDVAPAVATRLSPHQVGVADLLDGARWLERYPNGGPARTRAGVDRAGRRAVRARCGESRPLVGRIVDEAAGLGFVFCQKVEDGTTAADGRMDVARLVGMS